MEAGMTRAYGVDLRRRVIEAIEGGMSTRAAARRYSIGESTAGAWHRRWRATGGIEAGRQGNPGGSVLDAHEAFILASLDEAADITLAEIAERLARERSVTVDPSTIWYFFRRHGITYKKSPRTPRSRSVRTSARAGKSGSTASSISIPSGWCS
jgi:transposase